MFIWIVTYILVWSDKMNSTKHEIGKAWKLTSSCCVVCVSPTSYKNKNIMNIYVKISSKKLGFSNTPSSRNQTWKCNFKHNPTFSSLKKHHFTHTCCRAKWTQLRSTQLVLRTSNVHHKTNCTCIGPLKQMINGFSTKRKLTTFHKVSNIHCTFKILFLLIQLITLHREEVASHILYQLQLLFGQHLDIVSLLHKICPLETMFSFSLSWSSWVLLINTSFLHLKL